MLSCTNAFISQISLCDSLNREMIDNSKQKFPNKKNSGSFGWMQTLILLYSKTTLHLKYLSIQWGPPEMYIRFYSYIHISGNLICREGF